MSTLIRAPAARPVGSFCALLSLVQLKSAESVSAVCRLLERTRLDQRSLSEAAGCCKRLWQESHQAADARCWCETKLFETEEVAFVKLAFQSLN